MKNKSILMLLFSVIAMMAISVVSAVNPNLGDVIVIEEVKVDGTEVEPLGATRLDLERGKSFDVRIEFSSTAVNDTLKDVQVMAFISGYEHASVEPIADVTDVFDVEGGVTYRKTLSLSLPVRADEDDYRLRVIISDRNGDEFIKNYRLKVDVPRHDITIRDVVFNPEDRVVAGRALLATVRVKNTGEQDQNDGVKVRVSIPDLGVGASDFIDEIDEDETTTSEELFMRIPPCAKAGRYDVRVTVEFNEGEDTVSTTRTIQVSEGEVCPIKADVDDGKVTITLSGESQTLVPGGSGSVYPIVLSNSGSQPRSFVLSVDGVSEWGQVRVSPSNVVNVAGRSTQSAFVWVAANAGASAGERMFAVSVKDASGNVLRQLTLNANVEGDNGSAAALDLGGARRLLEIGLVVLVVIIVLIGLVIALRRMRGPGEGEETQTYY